MFRKRPLKRLPAVRKNLTYLPGGEFPQNLLYDLIRDRISNSRTYFSRKKEESWKIPSAWLHCKFDIFVLEKTAPTLHMAMTIAVILIVLQPWGVPVVVPRSLTDALCPWLWESFPNLATDPPMLSRKASELPRRTIRLEVSSWTWVSLGGALERLQAVSSQHFSGLVI